MRLLTKVDHETHDEGHVQVQLCTILIWRSRSHRRVSVGLCPRLAALVALVVTVTKICMSYE
jgi:hypothetical protein